MFAKTTRRRAFSLVELVIVVVILGIIGAIAIPRMSRGASGAGESALIADLAALRNAVELYKAEHEGNIPAVADFVAAMTTYTDASGDAQAAPDATHVYGPYLHAIPSLKVGANKGNTGVAASAGAGVAWVYNDTTGKISANATETSSDGVTTFDDF